MTELTGICSCRGQHSGLAAAAAHEGEGANKIFHNIPFPPTWVDECPKGSICHPTRGMAPNVCCRNLQVGGGRRPLMQGNVGAPQGRAGRQTGR